MPTPSFSSSRQRRAMAPSSSTVANTGSDSQPPSSSTSNGRTSKRSNTSTEKNSQAKRSKLENQENVDHVDLQDDQEVLAQPELEVENDQNAAASNVSTPPAIKVFRISRAQEAIFKQSIRKNDFPENSTTRITRQDLLPTKNTDTVKLRGQNMCFICCGVFNEDSGLVICQGQVGTSNCVIKMHAECAPNHNPSGLNIPYAASVECQNKVLCPLHVCSCCDSENYKQRAYEGTIIQCKECLNGFHEQCVPVGSVKKMVNVESRKGVEQVEMLTCPMHVTEKIQVEKHLEICAQCKEETGDLVHCRLCVQSYHAKCRIVKKLDKRTVPMNSCDDCASEITIRRNTLVVFFNGEKFVLAKTSDCDAEKLGYTILTLADGTTTSTLICNISPVKHAYLTKISEDDQKHWDVELKNVGKLPKFPQYFKKVVVELKTNKITTTQLPEPQIGRWPKEMETCADYDNMNCDCPPNCKPIKGECWNRKYSTQEVNPNMRYQEYEGKGFGVAAVVDIKPGVVLGEYVGEVKPVEEIHEQNNIKGSTKDLQIPFYFMEVNSKVGIDAARMGNVTRYLNHSCKPNAVAVRRFVFATRDRIEERIFIETSRKIKSGEEITIDYGSGFKFSNCQCGADNCISKKTKSNN